jgi:hypothetical protein
MRRHRRSWVLVVAALVAFVFPLNHAKADAGYAAECGPPSGPFQLVVGKVACQRFASAAIGGVTAFSYYVPPACAQSGNCPVVYLMHGTGGDYTSALGTVGSPVPPPRVAALTSGPPIDVTNPLAETWNYTDPTKWVPKPPINVVFIAPNNRTVPGGYGPTSNPFYSDNHFDGLWANWNPRYALGGEHQLYDTPPPRFEDMVADELLPFVDAHFPVGHGREYRAAWGFSEGGLGALLLPLSHPDLFGFSYANSGASIPLGYPPLAAALRGVLPGVGAPVALPYVQLPGEAPGLLPATDPTGQIPLYGGIRSYLFALGDPVADEAYWRGYSTEDVAANARAWSAAGTQSLPVDLSNNDALPWRVTTGDTSELTSPSGSATEVVGAATIAAQQLAFVSEGVSYHYELGRGPHGAYAAAYYRHFLEQVYAGVMHSDGTGAPAPAPTKFDYRTISTSFGVWGWKFSVARTPVEFLQIRDATCLGLTLQGSGIVHVTVPANCQTGVNGSPTFTVDLGPSMPTDEHLELSATGSYGKVVHVALTCLVPQQASCGDPSFSAA